MEIFTDRLIPRRSVLQAAAAGALPAVLRGASRPPNIILIYADDMGYGDLGCYGSSIRTPNLDRMAREGIRFTSFTSANPLCSPSRAALMTGRYPPRAGVPRNFGPSSTNGMPLDETTLAQVLKARSYKTMCIGKWHLGHRPEYLPTSRGFDAYFGIPYSNDMPPACLIRDQEVIEPVANLANLTQRYTHEAVNFIERSKNFPFFLYHPHTFPHVPLHASPRFRGRSSLGLYGDVLEEMDWGIGEILACLTRNRLDRDTLVIFSSDNGPWHLGSAGPFRGRKGMTYEGGVREPFIARWPGKIPAGKVSSGLASTIDILPTVARLCGAPLPAKPLDGIDIWPLLAGEKNEIEREIFLYFENVHLQCARLGRWKLHLARYNLIRWSPPPREGLLNLPLPAPELYELSQDPSESYNVAPDHPEIVKDMIARVEKALASFGPGVRQAYAETMARKVRPAEAGSLPRLVE